MKAIESSGAKHVTYGKVELLKVRIANVLLFPIKIQYNTRSYCSLFCLPDFTHLI